MEIRFSQLVVKFLTWAAQARHKKTVDVYRHYLRRFMEQIGDPPAASVTPADVTAWAKTWHQAQAVKRLYQWAVEDARLLERNPVSRVKLPPMGMRRRILTRDERQSLLASSSADLRRFLVGLRETMARPGELRRATWNDVMGDDPTAQLSDILLQGKACIVLWEYKSRERRANADVPRVILLSPVACRLLLWLLRSRPRLDSHIFLTCRARAWTPNALRCRFRRLRRKLSIERDKRGETIVPYTYRHTSATEAAAQGIRDRVLADVLGHVKPETTQRYLHLQTDHLRKAMEKLWKPR